jgi:putative serine protease PepD
MNPRTVKLAAGALVLAGVGAVGGAAVYAAIEPGHTTTVYATGADGAPDVPAPSGKGLSPSEIYRLVSPGIVDITIVKTETNTNPYAGPTGPQTEDGEGTGWVYDRLGDIVTNDHVVGGTKSIIVRFQDNQTFKAHIVARDTDSDIAVIKVVVPSSLLHPLTLADSALAEVGDPVVAIGSPFGHAESLSAGVVSGLHVPMDSPSNVPTDSIQTDAAINPGNSGGPLLNTLGQVLGITTSTESRNGYSNGVGFVIPSNTVRSVVVQMVAGHKVAHGYFGASLADSTAPLGARLVTVPSAGPAAQAGMKPGDVVTQIDGVDVADSQDMIGLTKAHLAGDSITLSYTRAGKSHTLTIKLGTRPA